MPSRQRWYIGSVVISWPSRKIRPPSAVYFAAPKIAVAMSRRVGGAQPVLLDPKVLWSADTLFVTGETPETR